MSPGNIVNEIVYRGNAHQSTGRGRREDEAKTNLGFGGVSDLAERETRQAISEIVDQLIRGTPGVANRQTFWVIPDLGSRKVRELGCLANQVILVIAPQEKCLAVS